MGRQRKWLGLAYLAGDLAAAEAAFFTAVLLRFSQLYPIPPFFSSLSYLFYALVLPALYLPVLWSFRVHRARIPSVQGLIKAVFVLAVLATVLPFYFRGFAFSRIVIFSFCALTLAYGLLWRFVFYLLVDLPIGSHLVRERVLLAATGRRLPELAEALRESADGAFEIVALAAEPAPAGGTSSGPLTEEVVSFDLVPEVAVARGADVVLLDPEGISPERWLALAEELARVDLGLRILSALEPEIPFPLRTGGVGTVEELNLLAEPISSFQALVKRSLDILVSLPVLVASSPLMLVLALAIRRSSPGPVLYRQERVGKNGVPFTLYKFRSMVREAESHTGPVWAQSDDKRIIPGTGHFLRRTGLDELPQFWNVLAGRMSLVGPRPERAFFFESYPQLYRGRLAVKPGLTGLAQISGRQQMSVEQKVRYDLYYIRHYSLALDIEILWRTFVMLILQEWRVLFSPRQTAAPDSDEQNKGPA
ncbi:MAG: sugar transferase [Candidatus Glassbacteria bacterium]|nr:sugar transferase [Candidatus Glassbacteria bacterium]